VGAERRERKDCAPGCERSRSSRRRRGVRLGLGVGEGGGAAGDMASWKYFGVGGGMRLVIEVVSTYLYVKV